MTGHSIKDLESIPAAPHKLRILIVDDNQINLSVLSTLLKRRFSALIDGTPVAVDSGLKAIQLLRTNVFDLILMDIQMPFLSGLDATLRIRNVEDDVLEANAHAHIVAVTTAVGDEPEAAYRRAGMDGMIGKPVRFQDMHHYITPLAREAQEAAGSVSSVSVNGQSTKPPLPPVASKYERLFYLPANATIRAPCPDICQGADFEKMLKAQTRASLRKSGAMAIGRGSTIVARSPSRRPPLTDDQTSARTSDSIHEEDSCNESSSQPNVKVEVRNTDDKSGALPPTSSRRHARHSTMTINKFTLSEQIKREMENLDGNDSDASNASRTNVHAMRRPAAIHRVSSPAWMMSLEDRGDFDDGGITPSSEALSINPVHLALPARPKWLVALKNKGGSRSQDSMAISRSSSLSQHGEGISMLAEARRDSQQSCASDLSDMSTDLTTPSSETSPYDVLQVLRRSFDAEQSSRPRAESGGSNNTIAAAASVLKINVDHKQPTEDIVCSPLEISSGRRSFSANEMGKLSHGIRQLGLAP